jgi:N-acetylglucosamine repressor
MRYDEKVTQNQTKRHNKRLVLRTIFETAETSRADVARETGLTRATVSSAVAELMEEGLVAELGLAPSGGGKPPTKLHVQPDGRHLIGVDLSSDTLQASIYNLQGQAVRRASLPLTAANGDETLAQVYALLDPSLGRPTPPCWALAWAHRA